MPAQGLMTSRSETYSLSPWWPSRPWREVSPVSVATRVSRSSGTLIGERRGLGEGGLDHGGEVAPGAELAEQVVAVPLARPHDRGDRLSALAPAHRATQLGGQQRVPLGHVGVGESVHVGYDGDGQREKRRGFERFSQPRAGPAPSAGVWNAPLTATSFT